MESDISALLGDEVLHPVYLPFSASTLSRHFAPVSTPGTAEDYLRYYRESADRHKKFLAEVPNLRNLSLAALRNPCQIEKDERFWTVACWLQVFYSKERTRVLSDLMRQCFGDEPPLKKLRTWRDCFDGDLCLYFEAHLPSPIAYKRWLRQNLHDHNLIPYVLRAASRENNRDFEGATHVDALLINPRNGFALLVEAKVLSDISCHVSFDVVRNQIARTVDVMLDPNPLLASLFAIAIPKILCLFSRPQPSSRLVPMLDFTAGCCTITAPCHRHWVVIFPTEEISIGVRLLQELGG
jgi:hypothetical protein